MKIFEFEIPLFEDDLIEPICIEKTIIHNFQKNTSHESFFSLEEEIQERLAGMYVDEGGSPSVDCIELIDFKKGQNQFEGEFNLQFTVYKTYGCDDLNKEYDDYLKFKYNVDIENSIIRCFSETKTRDEYLKFSL